MATQDLHQRLGDAAGRQTCTILTNPGEGVRYLVATAPPHAISAGFMMCMSIFNKAVVIPGFRHRSVSQSDLFDLLGQAKCTKAIFVPWMMEEVARSPDAEKFIKEFDHAAFGGAVLSAFAASVWAKHTKIQNMWGSTESLACPTLTADNEDYSYVYFNTFIDGFEFRQVNSTGYLSEAGEAQDLYEQVHKITEQSAPLASWHARQNIGLDTTPPVPEWHTGDLWTPHPDPEKARFAWKFVCRKDDLISFSTGVNGNPVPLERDITNTAEKIRAAIVVGAMHQQSLALVEVAEGQEASPELAAELWEEHIKPANEKAQTHIRVAKTHVLLVPAGGFPRTAKGSVVRNKAQAKFKREIEKVYEKHGDQWHDAKDRYGSISHTTSITIEVDTGGA